MSAVSIASVQMLVEVPVDVLPELKQVAHDLKWTLQQVVGQACLDYADFARNELIPLVEVAKNRRKAGRRDRANQLLLP